MRSLILLYLSLTLLQNSSASASNGMTCSGIHQIGDFDPSNETLQIRQVKRIIKKYEKRNEFVENGLFSDLWQSNGYQILIDKVSKARGGFSLLPAGIDMSKITSSLPVTELWFTKAVLQLILTIFNVLCWIIPLRTKNFSQNVELLSLANCFAGGIFLMLSFGHLIPEAISFMSSIGKAPADALRFALIGFLMMFFIEKVAFNHEEMKPEQTEKQDGKEKVNSLSKKSFELNSAMVLCLAMSFHSFFEAAALGLATDFSSAFMMAASIGLHQPAESIALLIAFLKTDTSERGILVCLTAFSCVALLGVAAGILISAVANPYLEAIVVAITAGTFIYVGATEILLEEFEGVPPWEKVKRFTAYILGMILMHFIAESSSAIYSH